MKLSHSCKFIRGGIDNQVEDMEFTADGLTYRIKTSNGHDEYYDPKTIEGKLKIFALRFEEVFRSNDYLRNALPTHFTELSKHLKL